ncbi:MAG TPA: hypothetical protein VK579_09490 [Terriglobales bacterium]|nr:hypothetical protein [Terriglobales bacterium]
MKDELRFHLEAKTDDLKSRYIKGFERAVLEEWSGSSNDRRAGKESNK